MLPILYNDQVETLEMEEENGVIKSLTRHARICDLDSGDYQVLLDAYEMVGLPAPGSVLVDGGLDPNTGEPPGPDNSLAMLILSGRKFKLVDKDPSTVDVLMYYKHFMEGHNQMLGAANISPNGWIVPGGFEVYTKNKASIQQLKTNFFNALGTADDWFGTLGYEVGDAVLYNNIIWICTAAVDEPLNPDSTNPPPPAGGVWTPLDITDLATNNQTALQLIAGGGTLLPAPGIRRQIGVAHTFPGTDRTQPGQTIYQTGEVTFMQPNENMKLQCTVFTHNPRAIKKALTGAINSVPWMDGNAYEWMCTEVGWEAAYVQWQYNMSFEFQHNEDSWLPTAIFNDQRVGRPPVGVVKGFGYLTLHEQPEVDFDNYFLVNFNAALQAGPG